MQRQEWSGSDKEIMFVLNTIESSRDGERGFVSVCVGKSEGIKPYIRSYGHSSRAN